MPHADQSRHLLQEDLSFNAIRPVGPDVPQPHLSRQRLGGDVYYDAIGPAGPAVPRSHQSYQRIREDLYDVFFFDKLKSFLYFQSEFDQS